MTNISDAIKERAKPLLNRYTQNYVNLYEVLGVSPEADIATIFAAFKSKRVKHDLLVEEAFYVLSSNFFRLVYDTAFMNKLGLQKESTDYPSKMQKAKESPTQRRRKKQTFIMMLIIGFILDIPTLFINIPIGSISLGLIIFIWGALIWLLLSWYVSYIRISDFDVKDKLRSKRIRKTLWIEPSVELAKYEIAYIKSQDEHKLLTDFFILDEQFDFLDNKKAFANNLVITDYWTKGLFGWSKKQKILIPIQDTVKIAERK